MFSYFTLYGYIVLYYYYLNIFIGLFSNSRHWHGTTFLLIFNNYVMRCYEHSWIWQYIKYSITVVCWLSWEIMLISFSGKTCRHYPVHMPKWLSSFIHQAELLCEIWPSNWITGTYGKTDSLSIFQLLR